MYGCMYNELAITIQTALKGRVQFTTVTVYKTWLSLINSLLPTYMYNNYYANTYLFWHHCNISMYPENALFTTTLALCLFMCA